MNEFGLTITKALPDKQFDAIVLTVSHHIFKSVDLQQLRSEKSIVYDVKNFIDDRHVDGRL